MANVVFFSSKFEKKRERQNKTNGSKMPTNRRMLKCVWYILETTIWTQCELAICAYVSMASHSSFEVYLMRSFCFNVFLNNLNFDGYMYRSYDILRQDKSRHDMAVASFSSVHKQYSYERNEIQHESSANEELLFSSLSCSWFSCLHFVMLFTFKKRKIEKRGKMV